MANILEFLRGVLTDPETQAAYRSDPEGFTVREGFGDLTGEDVVEAIGMLRRSLPQPVADALAAFEDEDQLPGVRTGLDERDLDAAIRMLDYAVSSVYHGAGAGAAGDPAAAPTDPDAGEEPVRPAFPTPPQGPLDGDDTGDAGGAVDAETDAGLDASAAPATAEAVVEHHEPIRVESELDVLAGGPGSVATPLTPLAPVTVNVDQLPSVGPFGESLAVIAADARNRLDVLLRALQSDLEVQVSQARDRFTEVLKRAEGDANTIRQAAHEEAHRLVNEAQADREAARSYLERTKREADDLLERARQHAEQTRAQADELLAQARAEDAAIRAELAARKEAMRNAEREMKERLAGLDSIFRSVLDDE